MQAVGSTFIYCEVNIDQLGEFLIIIAINLVSKTYESDELVSKLSEIP